MLNIERLQNDAHTERMGWIERQEQNRVTAAANRNMSQTTGSIKTTGSIMMNAEKILGIVRNVLQRVAELVGAAEHKFVYRKTVKSAYTIFAKHYPDAKERCFDEHFITESALPLLIEFLSGKRAYSAEKLATAWTKQFFYTKTKREQAINKMVPLASEFIYILKTEAAATIESKPMSKEATLNTRYA